MEEQRGYTITETQVQVQARVNTSSCPRRMLAQPKHTRKWLSLHSDQGFQLFVFLGEGQQTFTSKHSSLSLQCKPVYWRPTREPTPQITAGGDTCPLREGSGCYQTSFLCFGSHRFLTYRPKAERNPTPVCHVRTVSVVIEAH